MEERGRCDIRENTQRNATKRWDEAGYAHLSRESKEVKDMEGKRKVGKDIRPQWSDELILMCLFESRRGGGAMTSTLSTLT